MNAEPDAPRPSGSRSEEKLPLKSGVGHSRWTPYGDVTFNAILGCMASATIGITIAVVFQCLYGEQQPYKLSGAVVTDSKQCGAIGLNVLRSGGSAVDAAVAVVLCLGVTLPHLTSLGGGGFIIIRKGGAPVSNVSINFLDIVPVDEQREQGNETWLRVPGVLKGLRLAHQLFGRLAWEEVVQPSARLAAQGFNVEPSLYRELSHQWFLGRDWKEDLMLNESAVSEGQTLRWPSLARTLTLIAQQEDTAFYNGTITDQLLTFVASQGRQMSREDFLNYSLDVEAPFQISYNGFDLLTPSALSGGPPLALAFRLLEHLQLKSNQSQSEYHLGTVLNVVETALETLAPVRQQLAAANISVELLEELSEMLEADPGVYESGSSSDTHSPVGTIALASDSQDLHVAIVTGLGSPFGWKYVSSAGITLSDFSHFHQPQYGNWVAKSVPLLVTKQRRSCQPAIVAASNDYRRLAINIHSWITHDNHTQQPPVVVSDEGSVGVIMRSNNVFRSSIEPVGDGFNGTV